MLYRKSMNSQRSMDVFEICYDAVESHRKLGILYDSAHFRSEETLYYQNIRQHQNISMRKFFLLFLSFSQNA